MCSGTIPFLLLILGVVSTQKLTGDLIQNHFYYLPQKVANEMANMINAHAKLNRKMEECKRFLTINEHYDLNGYTRGPDEPGIVGYLERTVQSSCMELVYHKRFELFAILPKKKIVNVYKAAELKALWMKIDKKYRNFDKTRYEFDGRYKSMIRPERLPEVRRNISFAYIEAYRKVENQTRLNQ